MKPVVWIRLFAPGIGDLAVLLPVLRNVKETYAERLNLIVHNEGQRSLLSRFPWVDRAVIVDNPRDVVPTGHFYIDMAETPMEKDYWWGTEEYIKDFGQMHIYDVMEKCIGVSGKYDELVPLEWQTDREAELNNTVLLGIGGRRGNKLWFNDSWFKLYSLLTEASFSVAMVGSKSHDGSGQIEELEQLGIPFIETASLADTIDVISNAKGMVSIDSGLMHLSATQGKPTVGLFGPMPSWLWGPKGDHVLNLDGGCGINCTKMPLDWECVGRPCMASFRPESVFQEWQLLLGALSK